SVVCVEPLSCSLQKARSMFINLHASIKQQSEFILVGHPRFETGTKFVGANPNALSTVQKMRSNVALVSENDVANLSTTDRRCNCVRYLNGNRWTCAVKTPLDYSLFVAGLDIDAGQVFNSAITAVSFRADNYKTTESICKRRKLF